MAAEAEKRLIQRQCVESTRITSGNIFQGIQQPVVEDAAAEIQAVEEDMETEEGLGDFVRQFEIDSLFLFATSLFRRWLLYRDTL